MGGVHRAEGVARGAVVSLAILVIAALMFSAIPPVVTNLQPVAIATPGHSGEGRGVARALSNTSTPKQWALQETRPTPPAGWASTEAYDAADGVFVLFGMYNYTGASFNDTWVYSNNVWRNLTSKLHPAPPVPGLPNVVGSAAMAYDPLEQALILYDARGSYTATWEFKNLTWTNVTSSVRPPGLFRVMLTYDGADQAVLLFGGENQGTTPFNETWEFQNNTWTNATTSVSPPARARGMLTYDPVDNYTVLFGGFATYGTTDFNDTWKFINGTWTNITPTVGPAVRDGAVMVYDPNDLAILLFGGFQSIGGSQQTLSDTWEFAGGTWTQLSPRLMPPGRCCNWNGAAYDAAEGVVVMFGGYSFGGYPLNDTWLWGIDPVVISSMQASTYATDVGYPVNFTSAASGGNGTLNLTWTFGDGTVGYGVNVSHTYSSTGAPYTVTLRARDPNNITAVATTTVTINPLPSLTATASYTRIDAGQSDYFGASTSGGTAPVGVAWLFGDGGNGTGLALYHGFASAGTYSVQAWANDSVGATAFHEFNVTVNPALGTNATVSRNLTDIGVAVDFSASAFNGTTPYSYHWSFGDGGSAATANASHAYSTSGTYTATVSVTDAGAGSSQASVAVTVASPMTTTLSANRTTVDPGVSVGFASSATGGVGPYNFTWLFGDGSTALGSAVSHAYTGPGTYTVLLYINDSASLSVVRSIAITVVRAPTASIFVQANVTDIGVPVHLAGQTQFGVAPFAYSWDFGDGGTGTLLNANHTYSVAGAFSVTFTVTDADGVVASATLLLTVEPLPSVLPTASVTATDVNLPVSFRGTGSGGVAPYTFSWRFGDGGSALGATVTHAFARPSSFSVNVTLTDSLGLVANSSLSVVVHPLPTVAFSITPSPVTNGSPFNVSVDIAGGTAPFSLSFLGLPPGCTLPSDGNGSCLAPTPGTYNVILTITDAVGSTSTSHASLDVTERTTPTPTKNSTGASPTELYLEIGGGVAAGLAVVVAVALLLRRRPPARPAPESPAEEAPPEASETEEIYGAAPPPAEGEP